MRIQETQQIVRVYGIDIDLKTDPLQDRDRRGILTGNMRNDPAQAQLIKRKLNDSPRSLGCKASSPVFSAQAIVQLNVGNVVMQPGAEVELEPARSYEFGCRLQVDCETAKAVHLLFLNAKSQPAFAILTAWWVTRIVLPGVRMPVELRVGAFEVV